MIMFEEGGVPVSRTLAILCPEDGYELNWNPSFQRLSEALLPAGIATIAIPWSQFSSHKSDAVSPLLAWGYQRKIGAWHRMLDGLSDQSIAINSLALLRWNSTKHYLFDLARAGIPIVPTLYRPLATRSDLAAAFRTFDAGTLIVKPVVGASSDGLIQVTSVDDAPASMKEVLIQPFIRSISEHGERSLVFFGGRFSHAVCKKPRAGDIRVQEEHGGECFAVHPSEECIRLGERAVRACPELPTYARVDIVRDGAKLYVMEVELIEPELYLTEEPENLRLLAGAFARSMN